MKMKREKNTESRRVLPAPAFSENVNEIHPVVLLPQIPPVFDIPSPCLEKIALCFNMRGREHKVKTTRAYLKARIGRMPVLTVESL